MNYKRIPQSFFLRPTLSVAEDLVGKLLVLKKGKEIKVARILETEAYIGEKDLACHARFGKTARNWVMYERGGVWYVYFVYGMHWLLNIITGPKNFPAGVMIRSAEPLEGFWPGKKLSGPALLTKAFDITQKFNGVRHGGELFFAFDGGEVNFLVRRKTRVGVAYAGKYAKKKWRFVLERKLKPSRAHKTKNVV